MTTQKFRSPIRFLLLFSTLFIGVMLYFINKEMNYSYGENLPKEEFYFNYGFIALFVIAIIWTINIMSKKITIDNTKLKFTSFLKNNEIQLQDIKGFVEQTFNYKILDHNNNVLSTFKHIKLLNWLQENFEDINVTKAIKEVENSLNDPRYGITEKERIENFKSAEKFDTTLTSIATVCFFLLLLFPLPNKIVAAVGLALAFLIIASLFYFKGKIRLERKTFMPSLFWAGILTIPILLYNSMQYGGFESFPSVKLMLYIALALTYLYIIVVGFKKYNFKTIWIPLIIFFGLSVTSAMTLNIFLDTDKPKIYMTQVVDKNLSRSSKSTTYTLIFSTQKKINEKSKVKIDVSYANFNRAQIGDKVELHLHQGYFNKNWYEIYKDDKPLNGTANLFSYLKYKILK